MYNFDPLRYAIDVAYRADEAITVDRLLAQAHIPQPMLDNIHATARKLVVDVRKHRLGRGGLDTFLAEYDLSSEEGVALMCLAEALLRIPDSATVDQLINDKLADLDWQQHLGQSKSTFVNVVTWSLMLTGKIINLSATTIQRLIQRSSEPIIRQAVIQAMKILGRQFVLGQTIEAARKRSKKLEAAGFTYSYDMLGEEACTMADAEQYFASYMHAIVTIGKTNQNKNIYSGPGISIKLSALHPRYEWRQRERVLTELTPKIIDLVLAAKERNIGVTIDAEEAERLDLSLDIFNLIVADPRCAGWNGLGLAVQAYQKRAVYVIDYIIDLARKHQRRIMLRLVKGAYWDSEIKLAQERGLSGYPVFTRKAATDVSYSVCVQKIFAATDALYPQFATHNAYTVALVLELAQGYRDYEFQCLYGMGDALYANIVGDKNFAIPCRVYAPVGDYKHLLAYLVRRLLENGANTSFVNRIVDERAPIDEIIADPVLKLKSVASKSHPNIPLPEQLYGVARPNSRGIDFTNPLEYQPVLEYIDNFVLPNKPEVTEVSTAIDLAYTASSSWGGTSAATRVKIIQTMAELLDERREEFIALLVLEAHKTIPDALAEVREAIDYCWYYAAQTEVDFGAMILNGPTGEYNQLQLHARGVVACISPWNFPLAIFLGQIVASLLAGNTVLAKPATQTPLVAAKAIDLLYIAGVPRDAVHLLIGNGAIVGDALTTDLRINGVVFTGSTATAKHINLNLAKRNGAIVPFIAETGGQNVMLSDSSVLVEQLVKDVISSAFGSAGQRCSSLRVLYLQQDVADHIIKTLCGAMAELKVGNPAQLATDIGPVIDKNAQTMLQEHFATMQREAILLYQVPVTAELQQANYFGPCVFEIKNIQQLPGEVFGPILHVIRYKAAELDQVIAQINNTGYGLTLGIQSRINTTVDYIVQRVKVGNIYVNRNMIGAVVGVQPFGGEGLSGTGPKAGGPRYVARLATERTLSVNTAAAGGNARLMSLQE